MVVRVIVQACSIIIDFTRHDMSLRGPFTSSYIVTAPNFVRSLTSEMHAYENIY